MLVVPVSGTKRSVRVGSSAAHFAKESAEVEHLTHRRSILPPLPPELKPIRIQGQKRFSSDRTAATRDLK